MDNKDFSWRTLDEHHGIWLGRVPSDVALTPAEFEEAWALHPAEHHLIKMHGRLVPTPRWQQAYGRDYASTGQINKALPIPPLFERCLSWGIRAIEARLNSILVNWYDGSLAHYIGRHRDNAKQMIADTPIVTISSGEERTFRLRPLRGSERIDIAVTDGSVVVMPFVTNQAWTHEVPHSASRTGRRISVTLRAFGN